MKYLALAVLLAVMQASPPIPRKAANNAGGSGDHIKQDSGNQQNPSRPTIATPSIDKNSSETPADANAHETIVIRETAPVPKARKDWWDKAYVVFTGLLVAVGAYGVYKAKQTLKVIERQAVSMRRQTTHLKNSVIAAREAAQANKKSADALINAERAWIMADIAWVADVPKAPRPTELRVALGSRSISLVICLICRNDGKTPAWITERSAWHDFYRELPTNPDILRPVTFTYSDLVSLSMGQTKIVQPNVECEGKYPDVGGPGLVLYGVVKYRDAFGNHETWYGYVIHGDPGAPRLERLAGFPEYNKNT